MARKKKDAAPVAAPTAKPANPAEIRQIEARLYALAGKERTDAEGAEFDALVAKLSVLRS